MLRWMHAPQDQEKKLEFLERLRVQVWASRELRIWRDKGTPSLNRWMDKPNAV